MRVISILMCAAFLSVSCGRTSSSNQLDKSSIDENKPLYVRVPAAMLNASWVQTHQFNRDHAKNDIYALGWLPNAELMSLPASDKASITILDEYRVARGLLNPFTLDEKSTFGDGDDGVGNAEDYHDYVQLTQELHSLADSHSEIAQLESIGKSVQGRDLWMMRISSQIAKPSRKPKLLYVANMHGDEVVGRELTLYHVRRLLSDYGSDARVTKLLNNSEIFVVVTMNPDGFELKQRYNARSIDLNRDFPDFTSDDHDSMSGRAVETAAVMNLHARHHFVSAINFHGGEVCFNLPWDTTPNRTQETKFGDDAVLHAMGRTWADSNATMRANSSFDRGVTYGYEWYEVNGGLQDWSIYYRNSMHATIELSYTKWPSSSQLPVAWNENKEAMLAHLERSIKGVHIEAVDEAGKPVNGIKVSVNTSRRSVPFVGNFGSRTTTDGSQTVTVEANGYRPSSVTVDAQAFDGHFTRVKLLK